MSVYEQLNEGMNVLIKHENEFKDMLLAEITFLVDNFEPCTYNATPEVSDSLHLSLYQLKELIEKIRDDRVINADAVKGIEQEVHDLTLKNDLRRPKPASFLTRMGLTSPTVATPVSANYASVEPAKYVPRPAPVASSTPAPVVPVASSTPAPVAPPKRTWMGALNDMFRPQTNPQWQRIMDDQLSRLPEATPVEHQVYQPSRGGRKKTRRKV